MPIHLPACRRLFWRLRLQTHRHLTAQSTARREDILRPHLTMRRDRPSASPSPAGVAKTGARAQTQSTSARGTRRRVSADNTWNRKGPIVLSSLRSDPGLLAKSVEPSPPAQLRSLSTSDIAEAGACASQDSNMVVDSEVKPPPKLESQGSGTSLALAEAVDDLRVTSHDTNEESRDADGDEAMEETPRSLLEFAMPESTLSDALEAVKKGWTRYWSFTMYRGPEDKRVTYHYCRDKGHSEQIAQLFVGEQLLGMDLEWKSFIRKDAEAPLKDRVSLIQLASQNRIGLFHIAKFTGDEAHDLMAPTLRQILEDENIRKIGVNISNDARRLRDYLEIDTKGIFELSHLHRLVKYAKENPKWVNKKLVSLSVQVEEHLQLPLKKDNVRTSDWTQTLKHDQIVYAASDVYASIHLYDVLDMKRRAMRPTPPMPENWEKKMPIRLSSTDTFAKVADSDDVEDDPNIAPVAEDGDILEEGQAAAVTTTPSKARKPRSTTPREKKVKERPVEPDRGPEYVQSQAWATEYQALESYKNKSAELRPANAALRAYALWQHHNFDVPRLAILLGVKEATVAGYVAWTLQLEDLNYDRQRMITVLGFIPDQWLSKRYYKIRRACFQSY